MHVAPNKILDVRLREKDPSEIAGTTLPQAPGVDTPPQAPDRVDSVPPGVAGKSAVVAKAGAKQAMNSRISLVSGNVALQDGALNRDTFSKSLVDLAVSEWDDKSQQALMKQLERVYPKSGDVSESGVADIAWAVGKLRQLLPKDRKKADAIAQFLAERGFRLRRSDTVAEGVPQRSLDRQGFRQQLEEVVKAGGQIDKRTERALSLELRDLVDAGDVFYAQWQIQRRINEGALDPVAGGRLRALLDAKVDGRVSYGEIAFEIRQAKKAGFTPEAMGRLESVLQAASKDGDALFYAQRVFDHQVQRAKQSSGAEAEHEATGSVLQQVKERFAAFLAPKLQGKFDRRAEQRELRTLLRDGSIDTREYYARRAAIVTSSSHEQYQVRLSYAHTSLAAANSKVQAMHAEMVSDLMRSFSDAMSGDTKDAHGNVIETAEERHVRQVEKRRILERHYVQEPERKHFVTQRARLAGRRKSLDAALASARFPSEQATLRGRLAAVDTEDQDLERPQI